MQDLPDWVKNSIKMFADDTEIWTKIASQDDADSLPARSRETSTMVGEVAVGIQPFEMQSDENRP